MPSRPHYCQSVFPAIFLPLETTPFPQSKLSPSPNVPSPFSSPPGSALLTELRALCTGGQWGRSGGPIPQMCWQRDREEKLPSSSASRACFSSLDQVIDEAWCPGWKTPERDPSSKGGQSRMFSAQSSHFSLTARQLLPLPCCTQFLPQLSPFALPIRSQVKATSVSWAPTVLQGEGMEGSGGGVDIAPPDPAPSPSRARHSLLSPAPSTTYYLVLSCS